MSTEGDGERPICGRCRVGSRECRRPDKQIRFIFGNTTLSEGRGITSSTTVDSRLRAIDPLSVETETQRPTLATPRLLLLASSDPAKALTEPEIVEAFAHYISVLAPWYDLNDPQRTFGTLVVETALQVPILFKAIVAFSARHSSKLNGSNSEIANIFHDACVEDFLSSMESPDTTLKGSKLAATCLLRSYEIINGGSRVESHLLGAYSYAVSEPIDFSETGISQAGAWNYLREEITVGLMRRRGVRMGQIFHNHLENDPYDVSLPNRITYLLAKVINFCFIEPHLQALPASRQATWRTLNSEFVAWKAELTTSFVPYSSAAKSGNPFPSLWMLRPWYVAAQQYRSVVEILLTLHDPLPVGGHISRRSFAFAEEQALVICGLAWTNDDDSAHVNAYGPLAFCGRYLSRRHHQEGLVAFLRKSSNDTGWPVIDIVNDLQQHWESEYHAS
ncbi:hypothetical protein PV08_02418 [Exophiala spinifera]|uniref:Zn(2)-C6 fungal-type domain-containing protein n=1 Tax=Exophiala spinifera TaxID=91928 RepID=A0A0D2BHN6_9EURO|nr:uncharacterized protein PV08_02418 [Exophiala spinifera]KIW18130.1 hypothetical protein PV08_02418 [Exophiala spinifera]